MPFKIPLHDNPHKVATEILDEFRRILSVGIKCSGSVFNGKMTHFGKLTFVPSCSFYRDGQINGVLLILNGPDIPNIHIPSREFPEIETVLKTLRSIPIQAGTAGIVGIFVLGRSSKLSQEPAYIRILKTIESFNDFLFHL